MKPRISLRRSIFYLSLATGFLFLVINVQQKALWINTFYSDSETMPGAVNKHNNHPHHDDDDPSSTNNNNNLINNFNNIRQQIDVHERLNDNQPAHVDGEDEQESMEDDELRGRLGESNVPISTIAPDDKERPWFMRGGVRKPSSAATNRKTGRRLARLWPHEDSTNDRITNQLMFVPPGYSNKPKKLKKILFYYGLGSWNLKPGRDVFVNAKCPVDTCTVTASKSEGPTADAILYKDRFVHPGHVRPPRQVWILYFLECPYHTQHIKNNDMINWTATYRRDSDIVAPYERWTYYDEKVKEKPLGDKNYAVNKTKKVAWFVSNCAARNNRLQYAHQLQKHIGVDIYGACGDKKCPRFPNDSNEKCFTMLDKDYKFYLAFENSNCRDYITEKFFVNGLGRNILPIVMGAHPDDYAKSSPEHSYIHVDDFASPKQLAAYLHKLDKDDDLYNSYFKWKGTGEFINTYFLCRLCAMLHDDYPAKSYRDINEWWRGPGVCTQSWRNVNEVPDDENS